MSNQQLIVILIILFVLVLITLNLLSEKHYEHFNNRERISISVFSIFKNNENYLPYFFQMMELFEKKYDMYYYFFENDSTDRTKELLENFMKNKKGKFVSKSLKQSLDSDVFNSDKGVDEKRGKKMAYIRNINKNMCSENNTHYTIVIDSEVYFHDNIIEKMIESVEYKQIGMVTPYNVDYSAFNPEDSNSIPHYYDCLALITDKGISYKDNMNTCMFKGCLRCKEYRNENNIKIDEERDTINIKNSEFINVKSAFGGFVLLKSNIFNNVEWGPTICEHHHFCNKIIESGYKIIVDPLILTTTNKNDNESVDTELINQILNLDIRSM